MKLSLSITDYNWAEGPAGLAAHLDRVVQTADDAGLDTVWVPDHLLQAAPGTAEEDPMLEAYTTLGYLAARSTRVQLGTAVSGVTFRPPAILIKAVTTLDVLTGGRAWFGVGAGYLVDEAQAMGLPLPPTKERFEHLEDTLRLAMQMWSGDAKPFEGTHFRLDRPVSSPAPIRRPRVLIGGTGEQKTLRLVARYGDACNVFDIPDGGKTITHKLGVLARHCADVGRPYEEIEKTVAMRVNAGEAPEAFAQRCHVLAELGLDHATVLTTGPWTAESLAVLTRARPMLEQF